MDARIRAIILVATVRLDTEVDLVTPAQHHSTLIMMKRSIMRAMDLKPFLLELCRQMKGVVKVRFQDIV